MGCLWLTLCDPDPPNNGQFLYSAGLIRATADAGLPLTVVGLKRTAGAPRRRSEDGVEWILADDRPPSRLARHLTLPPIMATRSRIPEMIQEVEACLAVGGWEAIVFDSICAAWALPEVLRYRARWPTVLVYLSHNHETTVARHLAQATRGLRRVARIVDYAKVAWFERRLARSVDLVTANTLEDCATFSAMIDDRPVPFLPPGYRGLRVDLRRIGRHVPRRAVVVGSFDWPPKRLSIEAFLEVASDPFAAAGIELQVVGSSEPAFLARLRQRFPAIEFTGPVGDVRPYMAQARLALVPDLLGGFKLKSLDYVFNRLPIFAVAGAVPGTPLEDGRSIRLFDSHAALVQGVIGGIDDLANLNRQQELAFQACNGAFDWDEIGRRLVAEIRSRQLPSAAAAEIRPRSLARAS